MKLIQYQILRINIIGIVWQTAKRIAKEILGMKGLKPFFYQGLILANFQGNFWTLGYKYILSMRISNSHSH